MHHILLLGAGKIGSAITHLLLQTGDYRVTVADHSQELLDGIAMQPHLDLLLMDVSDEAKLIQTMAQHDAVLSALPFQLTSVIARSAHRAGIHYFDLTEDVASTKLVKELASSAQAVMMPQCGLAPGFISVVAHHLCGQFEQLENVHMRVGALPRYPSNALQYNLTWSTDGLINEYLQPCEAIVDGELVNVPALEELEHFSLDGVSYEAFNTSGGLGTLCETLRGRARYLNYRSVRYPGHRDIVKLLSKDLRLGESPALFKRILEHALPVTAQDVVLIFVTVSGERQGRYQQESFAQKVYSQEIAGRLLSAIQITTAGGICAMLDLVLTSSLPQQGFLRQEDVPLPLFLANRFGSLYSSQLAECFSTQGLAA